MSTTVKYKGATLATVTNQTKTLLTSGTWLEDDIELTDAGSGGTPTLQTKSKTYTPTTSQQTESVTFDAGYDGLQEVDITVNAMPTGSEGNRSVTRDINTVDNRHETEVSYPNMTPGYFSSLGTYRTTLGLEEQTIYPSTSDQTAAPSAITKYLNKVTVKGVTTTNLTAANIKSGVTVEVGDSADPDRVASVTGTYTGGTSKNAQVVQQGNTRIASSSYIKACGDITVSKTGTYDVYWTAYRTSTSGTWGTQLYIGSSSYGSVQSTFSSYYQTVHLSNVSLTANQKVSVYGRSRGSNYYLYVGQLTIIEA